MNFYQSPLWRHIQQDIYKKPTFELTIKGQECFGIIKTQRRLGKELNRYMVHWVQWIDLKNPDEALVQELTRIQRDHNKSRGDIFFQFGCLDTLRSGTTNEIKKDAELVAALVQQKIELNQAMRDRYQLLPAWREHMPDTTVQLPLTEGITQIRKWYSSSGKRYINKAKKEDLSFEIATSEATWKTFWAIRYSMAYDKWFAIVPEEVFIDLMYYLTESGQGRLMLARKGNRIVSGSVVLSLEKGNKTQETRLKKQEGRTWDKWKKITPNPSLEKRGAWGGSSTAKQLIYLYGATNREYGNIWGHYRLTDQILKRWSQQWYEYYDLLWVAPPGDEHHYLSGVTRFKQAFGGNTIYSAWNYDSIYNAKLYRAMQVMKKWGRK